MLCLVVGCQWFRLVLGMAGLALLSACAVRAPIPPVQEAAQYKAHAERRYPVPGTPADPWGPYINEASVRFDVPARWIREVMRVESGGLEYQNGQLTTSWAGAMGLMQVMPETFDEMRSQYGLGDDPYDPHNNILAGTAYIRQMYDLYGSPGFLAAYNAGPARLDDYLTRRRPLPDETRHYVAMIGPYVAGISPNNPSAADQLAMNHIPIDIPAGPRHGTAVAQSAPPRPAAGNVPRSYQMAELPTPPVMSPPPGNLALPTQMALVLPPSPRGFHLIASASADTLPQHRGGPASGNWAIQVGAYANEGQARAAAETARSEAREALSQARPAIGLVHQAHGTLYRARLVGVSRDAAVQACERISRSHTACVVVSPEAQS